MITVDPADPTPPFEQIRRQIDDLVRAGGIEPGARMPSVRQLAGDLGLANGTVARAYAVLETAGVLATDRTGTRVRAVEPLPAGTSGAAAAYVEAVRGLPLEEALRAVRVEWLRAAT